MLPAPMRGSLCSCHFVAIFLVLLFGSNLQFISCPRPRDTRPPTHVQPFSMRFVLDYRQLWRLRPLPCFLQTCEARLGFSCRDSGQCDLLRARRPARAHSLGVHALSHPCPWVCFEMLAVSTPSRRVYLQSGMPKPVVPILALDRPPTDCASMTSSDHLCPGCSLSAVDCATRRDTRRIRVTGRRATLRPGRTQVSRVSYKTRRGAGPAPAQTRSVRSCSLFRHVRVYRQTGPAHAHGPQVFLTPTGRYVVVVSKPSPDGPVCPPAPTAPLLVSFLLSRHRGNSYSTVTNSACSLCSPSRTADRG